MGGRVATRALALFLGVVPAGCLHLGDDWPDCAGDEHVAGGSCVPNVFEQASLPNIDATEVELDANGLGYVRSTLLVGLRDPTTTREAAAAFFASLSGELTGWIPFIGFYRV